MAEADDNSPDQILPIFDRASLSENTQESLTKMSLEARIMEYDGMQDYMHGILEDPEQIDDFNVEGYEENYADREKGFYEFGPRNRTLFNVLTELTDKGHDTRRAWQIFAQISHEVWRCAPGIYKLQNDPIKKPDDYDPNNPYPERNLKDHLQE